MKTRILFLLGLIIFTFSAATAQKISENKVPQDVITGFKDKFADAEIINWELNKDIYIAKFKLNDQEGKAEFTDKGVWTLTKYDIIEKELPTPILNYYKENYRGQEMNIDVSELRKNNLGNTFYYLELKKEGYNQLKPVELTFDLTGKLLTKTGTEEKTTAKKDDGKLKTDNKNVKDNTNTKDKKDSKDKRQIKEEEKPIIADENQKYIIDAAKVPAEAKSHFISKVKKPLGSVWYYQDKIYTVKFNQAGKSGQSTYTKEGVWIETRQDQSPETLHQLILAYLKDNYRNYKIKTAELVTQPKDKSIFIRIYDKRSKETPPPLTEMYFSTIGKLVSVNKADVIEDNESDNFNQKRQEEKDNEFLSDVDKKGETYENSNNYNDKISFKELPTPIPVYLKQYYKEHYVNSCRLVSDDELGNIYLITVKLENSKYPVHLYFDLQGKFLKKIDEAEGKIKKDNGKTIIENKDSKKPVSKYGTAEESVNPSELPESISKYLKKNYPQHSITESYFKTDGKLGNCYLLILKKSGENKIVKVFFDLDGNMLKAETENL
jgi:hypothetical protein